MSKLRERIIGALVGLQRSTGGAAVTSDQIADTVMVVIRECYAEPYALAERNQAVYDMVMAGAKQREVGDRFGLTASRVSQIARKIHRARRRASGDVA